MNKRNYYGLMYKEDLFRIQMLKNQWKIMEETEGAVVPEHQEEEEEWLEPEDL